MANETQMHNDAKEAAYALVDAVGKLDYAIESAEAAGDKKLAAQLLRLYVLVDSNPDLADLTNKY